jgi:ketosteroid isomerase-like protein
MPPSSGKDAIRNTIKQMISDPALSLKFRASKVEVAKSGDEAFTQGS